MLRKFFLSFVLVLAGFAAGMVLTARTESRASELAPPPAETQVAARASAPAAPIISAASAVGGAMADFSRIAGQAVKGVANISSLQVVRTSNSPFGTLTVLPVTLAINVPVASRATSRMPFPSVCWMLLPLTVTVSAASR